MTFKTIPASLRDQRGQMFAGYIVAILVLMALAISMIQRMTQQKRGAANEYYRELAVSVAKAGFEDGASYFRRQPGGVDASSWPNGPSSQAPTNPWPVWPDAAFAPGATDTDYFALLLTPTSAMNITSTCAGGIVRTAPLNHFSLTPTAADALSSGLWGRYVIRRQNTRNWSPGDNTVSAFTDGEAVHDITAMKTNNPPGSGTTWSLVSHAYVFSAPTDISDPAAFVGRSLLNAPLATYKGQALLRAQASVYGEISRINFHVPGAALFTKAGGSTTVVNAQGIVDGGNDGNGLATPTGAYNSGSGVVLGGYLNYKIAPSVPAVFPGFTMGSLMAKASAAGPAVLSPMSPLNSVFPSVSSVTFTSTVSTPAFLYWNSSADFTGTDTVMTGVGMVFINGNLTIEANNPSAWAGLVFVNGNVVLRGPADISGILICTGTVSIGNASDINKTTVEYNASAITNAQTYLENFTVNASSVVVSGN